jgi:hypothetical protein
MATPAAAAAFAAANQPIASTSSNQNNNNQHPLPAGPSGRGAELAARLGNARTYTPARGNGMRRGGGHGAGRGRDEDVGMNDVGSTSQGGRSKQTMRRGHHKGPNPMGERVGFRLILFLFNNGQTKVRGFLPAHKS